jgi:MinD-like ATPase involved in chromosome partitioning or flagellar assembly
MDPLTGTVSFLLKLTAGYSFMDVLGRAGTLDADLWKQMVVQVHGVDVLLSPETPPDPDVDLPTAAPIVDYAQESYQAVVLDCGGPHGGWNLSMAHLCDDLLLVTTNELASLQGVQKTVAYLEQNRINTQKIKFVVNRFVKDEGLNSDRLSSVLGTEPLQIIPYDPDSVQRSLMEGKQIASNSAAGKGMAALAERVFSFKDKGAKKESGRSGLRGIFSR